MRISLQVATRTHAGALRDLNEMGHLFDLDRNGTGTAVMDIAVDGIEWNMIQEIDPDGVPWPQLSAEYADWKYNEVGDKSMGVLYGVMRTIAQLSGERTITADAGEMIYGTDPIARTECDKFQLGGIITGTRQPPRPFYGLTREAVAATDDKFDDLFTSYTVTP